MDKIINLERELVAGELDHRIKNLFALVIGLVNLSVRETPQLSPLAEILKQRLDALHHAHRYVRISGTSSPTVARGGLKGLIAAILRPYAGRDGNPAAEIDGDDALIDVAETTSFALLIHELAINSVKYGALAAPDGKIAIRIASKDHVLRISWIEFGAANQASSTSNGRFGSTLLKRVAERQLAGLPAGMAKGICATS